MSCLVSREMVSPPLHATCPHIGTAMKQYSVRGLRVTDPVKPIAQDHTPKIRHLWIGTILYEAALVTGRIGLQTQLATKFLPTPNMVKHSIHTLSSDVTDINVTTSYIEALPEHQSTTVDYCAPVSDLLNARAHLISK